MSGNKNRIAAVGVCVAALLPVVFLTYFLRLPSFGEAFCNPDVEGIAYSACNLLDGGAVYTEGVETKPPGVYMVFASVFAAFGRNMTPVYVAASAYHVLAAMAIFAFCALYFGTLEGVLAAYLYAFFSALHFAAGKCPNFETWILLPVAVSWIGLVETAHRKSVVAAALTGAGFAVAVSMKQQALIMAALAQLALYFELPDDGSKHKKIPGGLLLAQGLGAAVVFAAIAAFMISRGGFWAMVDALDPRTNLKYASSESLLHVSTRILSKGAEFLTNSWALFGSAICFAIFGKRLDQLRRDKIQAVATPGATTPKGRYTVEVWLLAVIVAVVLPMKLFDHYLMLFIGPLAILGACFYARLARATAIPLFLRAACLILAGILITQNGKADIKLSASAWANLRVGDAQDWTPDHDIYWQPSPIPRQVVYYRDMQVAAACVSDNAKPGDFIYVWDYAPGFYFYSRRKAPTRHFMYFEVATELPKGSGRWHAEETPDLLASRKRLLEDLAANPPAYFITYNHDASKHLRFEFFIEMAPMFDDLDAYYKAHYEPDKKCGTKLFSVSKRKKKTSPDPEPDVS